MEKEVYCIMNFFIERQYTKIKIWSNYTKEYSACLHPCIAITQPKQNQYNFLILCVSG